MVDDAARLFRYSAVLKKRSMSASLVVRRTPLGSDFRKEWL
jgi:hypothetical protein